MIGKTSMLYWYPLSTKAAGDINVPKTIILELQGVHPQMKSIIRKLFMMKNITKEEKEAVSKLAWTCRAFAEQIGYPLFIRNDYSSHKHEWSSTCYVTTKEKLFEQVYQQLELNIMSNLNYNAIIFRELIDTRPIFYAFDSMPVTKERRYFIKDGKVVCHHPYWPSEAFRNYDLENWQIMLANMNREYPKEVDYLTKVAERISNLMPEFYSVDFLMDRKGKWWLIDMAEGEVSYHWKECQYANFTIAK